MCEIYFGASYNGLDNRFDEVSKEKARILHNFLQR